MWNYVLYIVLDTMDKMENETDKPHSHVAYDLVVETYMNGWLL